MAKLSEKRRRFVEAYMGKAKGNKTEAAKIAGYSPRTAKSQGQRLLTFVDVQKAIKERQANDPLVASREDRQRFWTSVMNDDTEDMRNRLRASEILGKASGDFIEHVNHSGNVTLNTINVVIHRAGSSD